MGLSLDAKKIFDLLNYLQELYKWNQAYNLSAIREPEEMIKRHLLDSLSILPILEEKIKKNNDLERLIDVGSGGGLPGIPLAICLPDLHVTLLDSNGKKTRFLFQTALKLGLKNIHVINERVESYQPMEKFNVVTSRAFASLDDMVTGSQHLLKEEGEFWAMKGVYPKDELEACHSVNLIDSHSLTVPELDAERNLIILRKL